MKQFDHTGILGNRIPKGIGYSRFLLAGTHTGQTRSQTFTLISPFNRQEETIVVHGLEQIIVSAQTNRFY